MKETGLGPYRPIRAVPTAVAMCSGPVSTVTTTSARLAAAAKRDSGGRINCSGALVQPETMWLTHRVSTELPELTTTCSDNSSASR
ncbi:MAG: hypothetical protein QGG14_06240, partial [Planctomycetota bacterium]|nr:hypothetical protein [Planctomycetota bacterium]